MRAAAILAALVFGFRVCIEMKIHVYMCACVHRHECVDHDLGARKVLWGGGGESRNVKKHLKIFTSN